MNKLSQLCLSVRDGDTIVLEKDHVYHVRQDDSFVLTGYYCSNTATKEENPDGTRYTALFLKDRKNITIEGNGAVIMVHGIMTPILLDGCENVTVRNLTIDYARPTMSEMTIVSGANGVYRLRINEDCRYEISDGQLWWLGEDNAEGEPYWKWAYRGGTSFTTILNPETNIWRFSVGGPGSSWPALPAFREIREIEKNLIEVVLEDETGTLPVGHVVQTRDIIRNQVGSFFVKCKNLTLSHMRVMFMHGLGLLTQFCDGVHYEYVNCMPKEGRTIASTADFFQFSGCRGEVLVEHCRASGAHDDFINVHGTYLRVIEADYHSKTVLVRFMHSQSWGFEAFFAGDRILFTARKTLGPIAENTVASVTRLNDTDIRLVLTDDLPEMTVGEDAVENITWRPTLTVRNNFFGTSSGHGILANAAGTVLIEDNVFEHNAYGVLRCALDCSLWYESGRPDHIILRHNRFDHCCSHPSGRIVSHTQICPPVHDPSFTGWVYPAVTFEENEFVNPPSDTGYHLQIARVGSVILRDNIFDKPYTVAQEYVGSLTAINTFTVKDS